MGRFAYWVILYVFCRLHLFCKIIFFSKTSFRYTVRVSNSLDLDQARRFVGSDLGLKLLQRHSANDTDSQRVNQAKSGTETNTVFWTLGYRNSGTIYISYEINKQGVDHTATILVPRLCHSYMFSCRASYALLIEFMVHINDMLDRKQFHHDMLLSRTCCCKSRLY